MQNSLEEKKKKTLIGQCVYKLVDSTLSCPTNKCNIHQKEKKKKNTDKIYTKNPLSQTGQEF